MQSLSFKRRRQHIITDKEQDYKRVKPCITQNCESETISSSSLRISSSCACVISLMARASISSLVDTAKSECNVSSPVRMRFLCIDSTEAFNQRSSLKEL